MPVRDANLLLKLMIITILLGGCSTFDECHHLTYQRLIMAPATAKRYDRILVLPFADLRTELFEAPGFFCQPDSTPATESAQLQQPPQLGVTVARHVADALAAAGYPAMYKPYLTNRNSYEYVVRGKILDFSLQQRGAESPTDGATVSLMLTTTERTTGKQVNELFAANNQAATDNDTPTRAAELALQTVLNKIRKDFANKERIAATEENL